MKGEKNETNRGKAKVAMKSNGIASLCFAAPLEKAYRLDTNTNRTQMTQIRQIKRIFKYCKAV